MSGSLTRGGGENVPGIPGACATRNYKYLVRGPWERNQKKNPDIATLNLNSVNSVSWIMRSESCHGLRRAISDWVPYLNLASKMNFISVLKERSQSKLMIFKLPFEHRFLDQVIIANYITNLLRTSKYWVGLFKAVTNMHFANPPLKCFLIWNNYNLLWNWSLKRIPVQGKRSPL